MMMGYDKEKRKETMRKRSMAFYKLIPRILGKIDNWGDGCWNWLGSLNSNGYALIGYCGKTVLLHRLTYELCNGVFDKKLCVLHKCDNRKCINPDHLFLGTKSDNMIDCANKNRQYRQKVKNLYCKQGHMIAGHNAIQSKSKDHSWTECRICRNETTKRYKLKRKANAIKKKFNLEG